MTDFNDPDDPLSSASRSQRSNHDVGASHAHHATGEASLTRPEPAGSAPSIGPELRWAAALLWLIGVVPSAGLGILLLGEWTSPFLAGTIGVVGFSLMTFPLARVAVVRALGRRPPPPLASSNEVEPDTED